MCELAWRQTMASGSLPSAMLALQKAQEELIPPHTRLRSVRLLHTFAGLEPQSALALERHVLAASRHCTQTYMFHVRRQAFNIACNSALTSAPPERLILMSDEEFAAGTIVERIQTEEQARMRGYTELLKEKYSNVAQAQSSESILKCRNCGSADIAWSQKQTRGADEASTCYCACQKCFKRWRLS